MAYLFAGLGDRAALERSKAAKEAAKAERSPAASSPSAEGGMDNNVKVGLAAAGLAAVVLFLKKKKKG